MRNYKRKRPLSSWTETEAVAAVNAVQNGMSIKSASLKYNMPKTCLIRRLKLVKSDANTAITGPYAGSFKPIFSRQDEDVLVEHLLDMQNRFHGLTPLDVRRMVFEVATNLGIPHPFNKNTKLAGQDWLAGFLKRHQDLSIRKPEATSLSRASGFHRNAVNQFYDLLEEAMAKFNFTSNSIYNFDETGISTVQKPCKMLAKKGEKQIGRHVSGERGSNITVGCAVSAAGSYIPPFFLFPRKRMSPLLLKGKSPGVTGYANGSGWMDCEHFLLYIDHFIEYAKPSEQNHVLLILDGHISHRQLNGVIKARENHITLLTLPPHCSHRMQPLDLCFFGPLKKQYSRECDFYMSSYPGAAITIYETVELLCKAFQKVTSVEKGIKGFEKSGIFPYNQDIFDETEFIPSEVFNYQNTTPEQKRVNTESVNPVSHLEVNVENYNPHLENLKEGENQCAPNPSCSFANALVKFSTRPSTHEKKRTNAKRRKESSEILTSTPVKEDLERQQQFKKVKIGSRMKLTHTKEENHKNNNSGNHSFVLKKRLDQKRPAESSDSESVLEPLNTKREKLNMRTKNMNNDSGTDSESEECLYYNELYGESKGGEGWIRCQGCGKWAHDGCAGVDENEDEFICDLCIK